MKSGKYGGNDMIKIAPSILAADPLHLAREIHRAEEAGCDWIHVDVMDAHFVPNLAYNPEVVKRLHQVTNLPLDVHLMMDHPESMLDAFLDAGSACLTVHAETDGSIPELLNRIRSKGRMAGIALKPETPLSAVIPYLNMADLVLAMTVEPGFGGQKLDERVIRKIRELKDYGYTGEIEADGGINEENLPLLAKNGLSVAVMGTALFRNDQMAGCISRLHKIQG